MLRDSGYESNSRVLDGGLDYTFVTDPVLVRRDQSHPNRLTVFDRPLDKLIVDRFFVPPRPVTAADFGRVRIESEEDERLAMLDNALDAALDYTQELLNERGLNALTHTFFGDEVFTDFIFDNSYTRCPGTRVVVLTNPRIFRKADVIEFLEGLLAEIETPGSALVEDGDLDVVSNLVETHLVPARNNPVS